ncbi:MAG: hypothetical protein Q9218_006342 [Villophora microphyllina]
MAADFPLPFALLKVERPDSGVRLLTAFVVEGHSNNCTRHSSLQSTAMPGPLSAFVGQPPLTPDDKLIVHGWQVLFGMGKADPSKGLQIAIKPPPPGHPHESDTDGIAVGCAISLFLMALFTGTRLLLRATNRNLVWGMDDWAILLATVSFSLSLATILRSRPDADNTAAAKLTAMSIPIMYCYKLVNAGAGKHVYDVTYWELANHQTLSIPAFALFYVAVALTKISIVLFYMRLAAFASRGWMIAHRTFIVCLAICATISLFITVFYCDPPVTGNIREVGRRNVKPQCLSLVNLIIGFNTWHILSDCLLLVVPFMMLWRVQMKKTTKLKVCIAGVIGFANVGLALARTIVQVTAKETGFDLTSDLYEDTATYSFAYSASELTLGVMTANLPVLSFVVTKTVEMLSWSSVSSNRSPERTEGDKRRSYIRRLHDDSKLESEAEFRGLRGAHSWEGRPTVRHDVEYGPVDKAAEVHESPIALLASHRPVVLRRNIVDALPWLKRFEYDILGQTNFEDDEGALGKMRCLEDLVRERGRV